MDINTKIYDRVVDHLTDVRLYEESVQLQNRRILQRHRKKLKVVLKENIRADVKPEIRRFGKELLNHQNSLKLHQFLNLFYLNEEQVENETAYELHLLALPE